MNSQEELNTLLNHLLPEAQKLLEKYGEFYPFSGAMENGKNFLLISAGENLSKNNGKENLEILIKILKKKIENKSFTSIGICLNVSLNIPKVKEKSAIQVMLEHREKRFVDIFLPYQKLNGRYEYGRIVAFARKPNIFPR